MCHLFFGTLHFIEVKKLKTYHRVVRHSLLHGEFCNKNYVVKRYKALIV